MDTRPRCALICVGSELLRGKINTHASTLSRRLASIGLGLDHEETLPDELHSLSSAIRRALETHDVTLVTGGLGPTFDDLSREAAAQALGRPLRLSKPLLKELVAKFKRARFRMPPANERQAFLIDGAEAIANRAGTAPGQWLEAHEKILILMPGPPSELRPMVDGAVIPRLKRRFPARPCAEAHLHFVGVPESIVDDRVRPIIASAQKSRAAEVDFTILAHLGLVDFDLYVRAKTPSQAHRLRRRLVDSICRRMGAALYGIDDDFPLEKVVLTHFKKSRATLSLAESCTGGMLAARLTDVAGSSDYFLGGVVSYSNDVKVGFLGVPKDILRKYGAVSAETARAMAAGVRGRTGSTWGLAITGIAGPGGGTPQKPVGLVYLGLANARRVRAFEFHFTGTRDAIRQRAVLAALDLLRNVR